MNKKKILRNKYVPQHSGDYFSKPWYKRDLMHYFDYVDYQEMCKHQTNYFKDKKNINFDITHHEVRADTLQDSYKNYQTVKTKDLEKYPAVEKEKTVSGIIRNIDRKDMYIEKSILKKHFFK